MMSRQEFFFKARKESKDSYPFESLYHAYEVYRLCPAAYAAGVSILLGKEAECRRCGNCCRRMWRIEVSASDILRWRREGRQDIMSSLRYMPRGSVKRKKWTPSSPIEQFPEGDVVIPKGREGCLYHAVRGESKCAIYETRPEVCVSFPRQAQ